MNSFSVKKVVILGGGSSGWMTAALLARALGGQVEIVLVESDRISTVGVGEATIPAIQLFNDALGIDEHDFLRCTKGTYKLGIQFEGWGKKDSCYMHAFGAIGKDISMSSFHHFWLRLREARPETDFWDYSLNYQAAIKEKFAKMVMPQKSPVLGLVYAFHFDAGLYARYLRSIAEKNGVVRIEGEVNEVLGADNGIASLILKDGSVVDGDLFFDCSGFSALLIEKTLKSGFEDWSHWLKCDSAWAVQTESLYAPVPYTRSIAREIGWQWKIPLQHRVGNGYVYSSRYISDEDARKILIKNIDGNLVTEPRLIKFVAGRRKQQWVKNCVSVGLSSGFLEPLESTSLHLVQSAVVRFLKLFSNGIVFGASIEEFNRQSQVEFEKIRDFIILHYHLNDRDTDQFWSDCKNMDIPQSLKNKIDLFSSGGNVLWERGDLFSEEAWQQVFLGQGVIPMSYAALAESMDHFQVCEFLAEIKKFVAFASDSLPSHQDYIDKYCS